MEKMAMKNEKFTQDEYDALNEIKRGIKGDRVSACVGRNSKRLSGLKLISIARNGRISLTDKGEQTLFLRRCVLALQALAAQAGQRDRCRRRAVPRQEIPSASAPKAASTSATKAGSRWRTSSAKALITNIPAAGFFSVM
jgi:hypothetical protein